VAPPSPARILLGAVKLDPRVTCTALVGGFLLGFLFVWIKFVPIPLAALGNPGAVLLAEAITLLRRIGDPDYGTQTLWPAVIETLLGLLVVTLLTRGGRRRLTAVVLALPLALLGWAALALAPLGGVNQ
jgi:uncharacterized protein DUF6518